MKLSRARMYSSPYGPVALFVNAAVLVSLVLLAMPAGAAAVRILAIGDSLTTGYGLPRNDSFPQQLGRALETEGLDAAVVNAGVSGDTSAGGRARLDWVLAAVPPGERIVAIVELGANDALRGLDPAATEANLDAIVARLKEAGAAVLLAGMRAPPNLGREYTDEFAALYPRLAARHGVALYPFFLDGVAADRALNLDDGKHPNAEGVAVIVERILPHVRALIETAP